MTLRWLLCAWLLLGIDVSRGEDGTRTTKPLTVSLRTREERSPGSGVFYPVVKDEKWTPQQTAIIVCDMWDQHWCQGASRRVAEIAPRMNEVLEKAREMGIFIIHSPSGCMEPYKETAARKRAQMAPMSKAAPAGIANWCEKIPAEEKGAYPIDQGNGGCDCHPHCKTGNPWRR